MSLLTSKISAKLVDMIPLECVSAIKWSVEYGEKIRKFRGKRSRPKIVAAMALDDVEVSPETLRLLEEGTAKTIQPDDFIALCNALEIHPSEIITLIRIGIP